MINKAETLRHITALSEKKLITREELNAAYDAGIVARGAAKPAEPVEHATPEKPAAPAKPVALGKRLGKTLNIAQILFYTGGAIIFLGIAILVGQNWSSMGFAARVMATMGAGVGTYFVGVLFDREERLETAAPAFFFISALVTPLGLYVIMENAGIKVSSYEYQSIISAILVVAYILSYLVFRKTIFALFTILFGTWFFFSITSFLISGVPHFNEEDFYLYQALIAGISYILLGRAFANSDYAALTGFLYNFGIIAVMGAALSLGGSKPNQKVFWEVIYPGLVFGTLFLSVQFKSKALLVWGAVFLVAYILKITSEYFTRGVGWPLALVVAGLSLIGVGYVTISIKKKYLTA